MVDRLDRPRAVEDRAADRDHKVAFGFDASVAADFDLTGALCALELTELRFGCRLRQVFVEEEVA